jgi:O-methyltransferase
LTLPAETARTLRHERTFTKRPNPVRYERRSGRRERKPVMTILSRLAKRLNPQALPDARPPEGETETLRGRILATVAPYTMVHETGIAFVVDETIRLCRDDVPGVIVECGVWRGGASLAALIAQRETFGRVLKPVYLLDSFEGLPPVTEKDGPLAAQWQSGADVERFMDNCRAAEDECRQLMRTHGFGPEEAIIVKGWFSQTLPGVVERVEDAGVAMLRLDGDWYDSTMECLAAVEPLVSEEGAVIIDDYYAWDGCARAVHDYLSRNDLPYRIKSLPYNFGAYMTKRSARRNFEQF